jgi:hypothetical protein
MMVRLDGRAKGKGNRGEQSGVLPSLMVSKQEKTKVESIPSMMVTIFNGTKL